MTNVLVPRDSMLARSLEVVSEMEKHLGEPKALASGVYYSSFYLRSSDASAYGSPFLKLLGPVENLESCFVGGLSGPDYALY